MNHSKRKNSSWPIHTQRGMTLISLMVSIVILLGGVLTSLRLHTNHERTIESVRSATSHNRLLMSALTVVQKELQGAGYGITDADENHVFTQFTASTSSTPASRHILWRYIEDGIVQCRGLRDVEETIDNKSYRKLELISSPADCNITEALSSFSWVGVSGTLGLWDINELLEPYITANETFFTFTLRNATCSNSRLTNSAEHLEVAISAPNIAELNGHTLPSNTIDLCLVNITPN